MNIIGWIVRTETAGRHRYWKVGEVDAARAAQIARGAASADAAKTISRIAARPLPEFKVALGIATEIWERRSKAPTSERSNLATEVDGIEATVSGDITFDIVIPKEGVSIVEGCYRIDGEDWKAYILMSEHNRACSVGGPLIRSHEVFQSGISGVYGVVPADQVLSKEAVMRILAKAVGVETWTEVSGPNSLILR